MLGIENYDARTENDATKSFIELLKLFKSTKFDFYISIMSSRLMPKYSNDVNSLSDIIKKRCKFLKFNYSSR